MLDLKELWHVEQHTLKHSCSSSVTSARVHKLYIERFPKSLHWNTLLSKATSPVPGCSSCLLIPFAFEGCNSSDISRLGEEEVFCSQRFEIPISLHLCLSSQTKLLYCWMLPQQCKVLLRHVVPSLPEFPAARSELPHCQQQLPEKEEPMVLPRVLPTVRVPLTLQHGAIRAWAARFGYPAQNHWPFVNSIFHKSTETIQREIPNTVFCPDKFLTHTIILPNSKYNLYKEDSLFLLS